MSTYIKLFNNHYVTKVPNTKEEETYMDDYVNSILTMEELSELKGALQIAEGQSKGSLDDVVKVINAKIAIHNLATKLDKA